MTFVTALIVVVAMFWGGVIANTPEPLPEPVYSVTLSIPPTPTDPVALPVPHLRPDPIITAAGYLELKAHYLEVGAYENPDALLTARAEAETDWQIILPSPAFRITHYPPETVDLILQAFFPEPVGLDWARRVGFCESSWDITALGALGEVGWFQHRPEFWDRRSTLAGYPGGDIWDPTINTAVAAFMYYSPDFGPSHWTCTRRVGL